LALAEKREEGAKFREHKRPQSKLIPATTKTKPLPIDKKKNLQSFGVLTWVLFRIEFALWQAVKNSLVHQPESEEGERAEKEIKSVAVSSNCGLHNVDILPESQSEDCFGCQTMNDLIDRKFYQ